MLILYPTLSVLLLFVLFRDQLFGQLLFTICFYTFAFWFATLPFLSKLKLPIDISYGVYLWGYFFQQLIYSQMGRLNIFVHILLATVASVIMAIITHYLIEKPFINYGKKLSLYLKSKS